MQNVSIVGIVAIAHTLSLDVFAQKSTAARSDRVVQCVLKGPGVTVETVAAVDCRGIRGYFVPDEIFRDLDRTYREVSLLRQERKTLRDLVEVERGLRLIETASAAAWRAQSNVWRRGYLAERTAHREALRTSSGIPWKTLVGLIIGAAATVGVAYALQGAR